VPRSFLPRKFHVSERLLQRLNPKATFDRAGTEIVSPMSNVNGLVWIALYTGDDPRQRDQPAAKR
jgi:hypothetical protein